MARPAVSIVNPDTGAATGEVSLPDVFTVPIRQDIVQQIHKNMAKNKRQASGVKEVAGHQHSAESWGTGRAVARIPRVSGGGTHRAGQAAFGNMCRKGRMFAPLKTWRQWHRESNLNERRIAVCSSLAASAVPSLVMARGHRVENVPEIPLVLAKSVEGIEKTRDAVKVLKNVGAYEDVQRVVDSKKLRVGIGKIRNRRFQMRRGPLLVHNGNVNLERAMRNIPGVTVANVERLNLLQLAPGGHLGRFVIFTEGAFARLDEIFGTYAKGSASKVGFRLPRSVVANADIARIINSDEIQAAVRPARNGRIATFRKQNPLRNVGALLRLNPYAKTTRRDAILASAGKRKTPVQRGMAGAGRTTKRTRSDKRALHKALNHSEPGTQDQPGADFLKPYNRVLAKRQ